MWEGTGARTETAEWQGEKRGWSRGCGKRGGVCVCGGGVDAASYILVLESILHKFTNRVFYARCCARCSIPRHDVCVLRPPQTDTRQQYYNTLTFLACTYACRNNVRSYACHIILWVPRNAATQTLETAGDMCVTARSSPCKYKGVWIYHTPPPSAPPPLTFKMSESVFFFIPIKTRSTYGPTIVFFFLFVSFFIVAIAQGSFAWRLILRP